MPWQLLEVGHEGAVLCCGEGVGGIGGDHGAVLSPVYEVVAGIRGCSDSGCGVETYASATGNRSVATAGSCNGYMGGCRNDTHIIHRGRRLCAIADIIRPVEYKFVNTCATYGYSCRAVLPG